MRSSSCRRVSASASVRSAAHGRIKLPGLEGLKVTEKLFMHLTRPRLYRADLALNVLTVWLCSLDRSVDRFLEEGRFRERSEDGFAHRRFQVAGRHPLRSARVACPASRPLSRRSSGRNRWRCSTRSRHDRKPHIGGGRTTSTRNQGFADENDWIGNADSGCLEGLARNDPLVFALDQLALMTDEPGVYGAVGRTCVIAAVLQRPD